MEAYRAYAKVIHSPGQLVVLNALRDSAASCDRCKLHESRTRSVFAAGSASSPIMFVGHSPGVSDDRSGELFSSDYGGGALFWKMIEQAGIDRRKVYVTNIVKCRPPENRSPKLDEVAECASYLDGQIAAISPKVIVAMGKDAARRLGCILEGSWRGVLGSYRGIPVMPTVHPAHCDRDWMRKEEFFSDLKSVTRDFDILGAER